MAKYKCLTGEKQAKFIYSPTRKTNGFFKVSKYYWYNRWTEKIG